MTGLEKNRMGRGQTDIQTDTQIHRRTCRLLDQLGPEGRVGEKVKTNVKTFMSGLSLKTKFNSGQTRETPYLCCFGLTTLQIRGVTFFIRYFFVLKSED